MLNTLITENTEICLSEVVLQLEDIIYGSFATDIIRDVFQTSTMGWLD